MQVIIFSSNMDIVNEWLERHSIKSHVSCVDIEELNHNLLNEESSILIADYDSVFYDINKLISSNILPDKVIVMERTPEIATGKMLISHGVKAYGNSRMLTNHYEQIIETVSNNKVWTYPELTAALAKIAQKESLSEDAKNLIENKLTAKESEVIYLILEGLTNDAIASSLDITIRTVKAHISAIFSKLHVNDRVALVLLLK